MTGVAAEQVGTQQQDPDAAAGAVNRRQGIGVLADAPLHARVIDADMRIFDGRHGLVELADQVALGRARVAPDEEAHHVGHVLARAAQPVLQRQKIRAHVLRCSRNEAQQLGQAPQHFHLRGTTGRGGRLLATQTLQQGDRTTRRTRHIEIADARQ